MKQAVHLEPGAIRRAGEILAEMRPKSIFLVTGHHSYTHSGAEAALEEILRPWPVRHFHEFSPNPRLEDVQKALALFRQHEDDLLLAVGGGSVIDMAKLIAVLAPQTEAPLDIIRWGAPIQRPSLPVIAVPTTAGAGSEATHFAVVYVDHRKYSLAHPSMLPEVAIVDADLTASLPPHITAASGLDALCQGIESLWAVGSTQRSKTWARQAVRLAHAHLEDAVLRPSPAARHGMARAAHLAGKAINLSKTTAAHALAYGMTSHFGVPHGHAVALTLGELLVYNSRGDQDDVQDPRGAEYVRGVVDQIGTLLGCASPEQSGREITRLVSRLGLHTRLRDVGIRTVADRGQLSGGVNAERLGNNPRSMPRSAIEDLLEKIV